MNNRLKQLIGVELLMAGALGVIVAYLLCCTSSNLVLLGGLLTILIGVILHVKLTKSGGKY